MEKNLGGAGGFNYGIKHAIKTGHDWVWIMDDDVIPKENALLELLNAAALTSGRAGYYSSVATDESEEYTVNVPAIDPTPAFQGYANWGQYLGDSIIKTWTATFVSLLLPREAIAKAGLPIKEFFIWGDDTEYTRRMTRRGIQGYWVGHSRVVHLRPGRHGLNIRNEADTSRIRLYRYLYRNWVYISRTTGTPSLSSHLKKSLVDIGSLFIKYRSPKKALAVMQGLVSGFFFNPQPEMMFDIDNDDELNENKNKNDVS
jgi:GT2 family glycosyltransferase